MKHLYRSLTLPLCLFLLVLSSGCGRSLPPIAPERLAPSSIVDLSVTSSEQGVVLRWTAPSSDLRGRKLKDIDGYEVYKRVPEGGPDFVLVTTIPDTHLEELEKLQDLAEKEGRIVRKVEVDSARKKFEWTDDRLSAGKTYLYKIVPVNQGGQSGAVDRVVRVTFTGANSPTEILPHEQAFLADIGEGD